MADEERPSRVVVSDAWRKEQQAKREAYEAKRRAWARMLLNVATKPTTTSPATGRATGGAGRRERPCRNPAAARPPGWHDPG